MKLRLTKQDALTFAIGLAAGVSFEVADALLASDQLFANTTDWVKTLGAGVAAATGRWIATYLTLQGFKQDE
jgi:hypothetical protein